MTQALAFDCPYSQLHRQDLQHLMQQGSCLPLRSHCRQRALTFDYLVSQSSVTYSGNKVMGSVINLLCFRVWFVAHGLMRGILCLHLLLYSGLASALHHIIGKCYSQFEQYLYLRVGARCLRWQRSLRRPLGRDRGLSLPIR